MAQISSIGSLPDPISNVHPATVKSAPSTAVPKAAPTLSDETKASPLQAQLTHFSAVLSSLQNTTNSSNRSQYVHAYNQVRSGSYSVNSLDVSKSIVNDSLTTE